MITISEKSIIVDRACEIIFSNEGDYGSVNLDDNGAVSIGKVQWHGCRALNLLKTILSFDGVRARLILGDSLYDEIFGEVDWDGRILNQSEAEKVSSLLTTPYGMQAQDSLAKADVLTYINKGISYGLSSPEALIYFADGVNQYGTESYLWKNIVIEALKSGGTLDAMHTATTQLSTSNLSRRTGVYEKLKGGPATPVIELVPENTSSIRVVPDFETIKLIQNWCNSYRFSGIIVDGIYGPQTAKALIQCLQCWINHNLDKAANTHSLNEDGIWGEMTAAACPYVSSDHNSETALAFVAQALLYLKGYDPKGIDSIFGSNSTKAARLFQSEHNLNPDGAVGALTFAQLVS